MNINRSLLVIALSFWGIIGLSSCKSISSKIDGMETLITGQTESLASAMAFQSFLSNAATKNPQTSIGYYAQPIQEQGKALEKTKDTTVALQGSIEPLRKQVNNLEGSWYVVWGKRINAFLWVLPIIGFIIILGASLKDSGITGFIPTICVFLYRLFLTLVTLGLYPFGLLIRSWLAKWKANRTNAGDTEPQTVVADASNPSVDPGEAGGASKRL